jgi:adenylate cyclase
MAILVIALRLTGGLQTFEWALLDQFFRWRSLEPPDSRVVIVGVQESDLQAFGFPVPDRVLAQALAKLKQQNPRAIGLDLVRDIPVEPGHQTLVQLFANTPNLIGINTVGDAKQEAVAPPPILSQRGQVGFNNLLPDGDEKVRRAILFAHVGKEQPIVSLSLMLAWRYLRSEGIILHLPENSTSSFRLGRTVLHPFQPNDGGYIRTDDSGFQILLNYRGPTGHFATVSLQDVLENRIPPDWAQNRIVLIGTTARSGKDFFSTPYSGTLLHFYPHTSIVAPAQTAGVEIHANITSQLLSAALDRRTPIQVWVEPVEWVWILLWSFAGAAFCWLCRPASSTSVRSLLCSVGGIALIAASLIALCYGAFLVGWWLPLVPPLLALTGSATALTAYIAHQEHRERELVMSLFERHVTPEIADTIWHDRHQFLQKGRLLGHKLTATILFADLRNFTPIAEQTAPEILVGWLNEYLEAMAQVIVVHGGVVDKFIGDSVMAVFGVPVPRTTPAEIGRDAQQAVSCALAMGKRLNWLNQQWQARGLPTVTMRVGIATGMVVSGSLGGFQKLDYTVIGDTVNVAARLEGYDKFFEKSVGNGVCRILISAETAELVQERFSVQFVADEKLKGRDHITRIYQVFPD